MKFSRHPIKDQGSVLVVAMVMTMLGGLFIAGWMGLAGMRAAYASNAEYSARRRVMLENSKVYATQIARQNAMSGDSTLTTVSSQLIDGSSIWGGIDTHDGWSDLKLYSLPKEVTYPYDTNYTTIHPFNAQGLRPGASFLSSQKLHRPPTLEAPRTALISSDYTRRFEANMNDFDAYLFLKAMCPCLAGDGLVVYHKPDAEAGEIELASNLYIDGRLVVREPACFFNSSTVNQGAKMRLGAYCKSLYVQKLDERNRLTGTDTSGLEIAASNMPAVPSTYGPYPPPTSSPLTTSQLYRGELNVIQNNSNTTNSLWHMQQREVDAARSPLQTISVGTVFGATTDPVYIRDETSPLYPPPNWPSGYLPVWKVLYVNVDHANLPNLRVAPVVDAIVFMGQQTRTAYDNAASMTPRSVILTSPPASGLGSHILLKAFFAFENNRPLILGAKGNRDRLELSWRYGKTIPAVATPLTVDWKLIFINEYRQVTLFVPDIGGVDSVSIVGGFLTNWSIKRNDVSGAAARFKIAPQWLTDGDANGYRLATLLPRDAWLESFFKLTDP